MKLYLSAFVLVLMVTVFNVHAKPVSVQAIALFEGKAMLVVNKGKPKIVKQGKAYQGVTLISSSTEQAKIEVDGKTQILTLNGTVVLQSELGASVPESSKTSVQLWEDERGFFYQSG